MTLRAVSPTCFPVAWGGFTLETAQTTNLTVGSSVHFDTVLGGNIPLSNGTFTLPSGRTFRVMGALKVTYSKVGYLCAQWYDVTNGVYFGTWLYSISVSQTAHHGTQPMAYGVITTTQPTQVQLRITEQTSASRLDRIQCFADIVAMN